MPINLNISPFYDDFDASKNYLRILFNPSRAVQARELTQAQSILQNQLANLTSHIFRDGSSIINARISTYDKHFLKFDALDNSSDPVDVSTWTGVTMTGATSGATAIVTGYDIALNQVYFEYKSGEFLNEERIDNSNIDDANISTGGIGEAMWAKMDSGIIYASESFIILPVEQEAVIDKEDNTGNYVIGVIITEQFVDADADSTLNDPANGSFNYNAPGADRLEITATLQTYLSTDTFDNNFIRLVTLTDGKLETDQSVVQYADILDLLARRTFDTSGNYVTEEFIATFVDHNSDVAKVNIEVSPGKAYVLGYENEKIATTNVDLARARTYDTHNASQEYMNYGPYFTVKQTGGVHDVNGILDVTSKEIVELMTGLGGTGSVVGTVNPRIVAINEDNNNNLRVYLQGAETLTSIFSSVKSIRSAGTPTNYVDVVLDATTNLASVANADINTSIFPLHESPVRSVIGTETQYNYERIFSGVTVSGGSATINPPANSFFTTDSIILVVDGTSKAIQTGWGITFAVGEITVTGLSGPTSVDILAVMHKTNATGLAKTLTQNSVTFTTGGSETTQTFPHTDIYDLVSVTKDPSGTPEDELSSTVLDNGQEDYIYNYGSVSGLEVSTEYTIVYRYFAHTGTGDYFTTDSYDTTTNQTNFPSIDFYYTIPQYTSKDGKNTYELRDCLDFRRSIDDLAAGTDIVLPDSISTTDFEFYIPRIDKLFINSKGVIGTITGTPSKYPDLPRDLDDGLTLYNINVPAYTFDAEDVSGDVIDNRNYTMDEIGELERRIENLEYLTSLNILEQSAKDRIVQDSQGLDKFKAGIITDNFNGHGIGDVLHPDYDCSIDEVEGILRAPFNNESLHLVNAEDAPTLLSKFMIEHANIATLAYTTDIHAENGLASESINVNPYDVFSWEGDVTLSPSTDNWTDTSRRPAIRANIEGANDAMAQLANFAGSKWSSWQTNWVGRPRTRVTGRWSNTRATGWNWWTQTQRLRTTTTARITTTTNFQQRRNLERMQVTPGRTTRNLGDRVIDTSLVPWIRSRAVTYTAKGLKPSTTVLIYFDDIDVSSNCTNLVTDAAGDLTGVFTIPAGSFRTGAREFLIVDDKVNPGTIADATYTAQGLRQAKQNTILSMDNPRVSRRRIATGVRNLTSTSNRFVTSTRDWSRTIWSDPIAESFLIDNENGMFLESIDIAFKTKDASIPVSIEIVENVNGYPSQNILPYSTVLVYPGAITTSVDGSVYTNFKFSDPVHVQGGTEYSFVLKANSTDYEVFVAKMGGRDLIDTNKRITKQPYTGVMFKSQNASTWTPDQERDIKFRINRCVFDTVNTGTYDVGNEDDLSSITKTTTTMMFNVDNLLFEGTSIAWDYKFAGDISYIPFENKFNIDLALQKTLQDTAQKAIQGRYSLTTNSDRLSPIIHLERNSAIIIDNIAFDDGGAKLNAGEYITRTVNLENPVDDLIVLFDTVLPAGAQVDVFFKTGIYLPRYVSVDVANASNAGKTMYVYHEDVGDAVTYETSFNATKIDETLDYVFLTSVGDVSAFVDPGDWAGESIQTIFITEADNVTKWLVGTAYSIGDNVWHDSGDDGKVYTATAANTGFSPEANLDKWDIVVHSVTSSVITDDTETEWRPMKLKNIISSDVDTINFFVEYEYEPEYVLDEEFSAFSVKLELRSNDAAGIPLVKSFRAIAVI